MRGRLQPTRASQSSAGPSTPFISCLRNPSRLPLGDVSPSWTEHRSRVAQEGQHATAAAADAVADDATVATDGQSSLEQMQQVLSEEENWDKRQQRAGAVARLVVYCRGETPSMDLNLAGGSGRPVQIVSLRERGIADRAGARIGDRLVSIDGKKTFMEFPAAAIQDRLKAPTSLVFMGFIGKLEAEVRLHNAQEACGISNQDAIHKHGDLLELRDMTVLNKSMSLTAPLFLTTLPPKQECKEPAHKPTLQRSWTGITGKLSTQADTGIAGSDKRVIRRSTPGHSTGWTKHVVTPCFELRHFEAHSLVQRAIHSLEATTAQQTEEGVIPKLPPKTNTSP